VFSKGAPLSEEAKEFELQKFFLAAVVCESHTRPERVKVKGEV
jgi:hypothetical protein